jgi:hypothetical protein
MICVSAFYHYLKAYAERKVAEIDLLREKWKTARERRRLYKEERPWINFDDPEYQRLWEIEIGAEDFYILSIKCNDYNINISWFHWRLEREEAEQKDDN